MCGKAAKMIDVMNVNQITKTMNQLFLANNEEKPWIYGKFFVYLLCK